NLAVAKKFLAPAVPAEEQTLARESLELYEELVTEYPTVPSFQHGCAEGRYHVGRLASAEFPDAAESDLRRSIELYRKLLSQALGNGDYRVGVREAHRELVNLLVSTGRSDEASRMRRQEIEIYQEAQTRLPNDWWLHKERARALSQLSEILERLERFEDAARAREEEFSEREWLTAALENDIYRKDVVEVRIYLARSYKSAGDWEKALAEFSKAIEQAAQR